MKWHIQSPEPIKNLAALETVLLQNRGIENTAEFFNGVSPFAIELSTLGIKKKTIEQIKKRLKQAKKLQEKIVIFGDYDADGICATAVLWQSLHASGYQVLPFIPNRLKHGYGLSIKALQELLSQHPDTNLIITVDNGIVAHQALNFLASKKIEVIISDHHQSDEQTPAALAVFHSTLVCGCAVAWFLAREVSESSQKALLTDLLALVAIATVTDLMPLLAINRSLLMSGLIQLKTNRNLGLQKLLQQVKIDPAKIDSYALGFQIGPRLNAMGRLADSMDALRLLCTTNAQKAQQLSNLLQDTNENRQTLTADLVKEAEELVLKETEQNLIFLSSAKYHEGIIGLIAGKLTEKFSKPSIVVSEGEEIAKASARSLADFNITEFIRFFKTDLLEMGGHPLAAGFALESKKIKTLKKAMQARAQQLLADQNLEKTLEIEAELHASLLQIETAQLLARFAPFGLSNPKPIFVLKKALLKNYRLFGKNQEHLRLSITLTDDQKEYVVLYWRGAIACSDFKIGQFYDLAFHLDLNYYRDQEQVQLILQDYALVQ